MAVTQGLVFSEPEAAVITHESATLLHSFEHDGHGDVARICPSPTRPPSLKVSRLSTTVSSKKRSRARAFRKEKVMMNRLFKQLSALQSLVPPSERSSQPSQHSVIADALRYKNALKNEIQQLQRVLPYAQQVTVVMEEAGLEIKVACKKKSGLLIALMEVMESFGLVFSKVNVCCHEDIIIDAVSTQSSTPHVGSLKLALMATIARFSSRSNE